MSTSRHLTALFSLLIVWATASSAIAQDGEITIAFFAPNVYFDDSLARASFISELASQVESSVGVPVRGTNISSASDLDNAHFAIVDGPFFAGDRIGEPILSARSSQGTAQQLALLVAPSGESDLSGLRGSTLILPRSGSELLSFVSSEILRGEIEAADFFGDIQYTSNIESALSAVASGRADATVGFADYASHAGLRAIERFADAPLPVVVQIDSDLDPDLVDGVRAALRGVSRQGSITGFTSVDSGSLSSFRRAANHSRPTRTPRMTPTRTITIEPGGLYLPGGEEPLPVPSPISLIDLPDMEEP